MTRGQLHRAARVPAKRPLAAALLTTSLLLPRASHGQIPPELSAQMDAETQGRAGSAEAQSRISAAAQQWIERLAASIHAHWLLPLGSPSQFSCTVRLVQDASGKLQSATIAHSCGSPPLDHSILKAVYQASPFPAPSDPAVFTPVLVLRFCPNAGCG